MLLNDHPKIATFSQVYKTGTRFFRPDFPSKTCIQQFFKTTKCHENDNYQAKTLKVYGNQHFLPHTPHSLNYVLYIHETIDNLGCNLRVVYCHSSIGLNLESIKEEYDLSMSEVMLKPHNMIRHEMHRQYNDSNSIRSEKWFISVILELMDCERGVGTCGLNSRDL